MCVVIARARRPKELCVKLEGVVVGGEMSQPALQTLDPNNSHPYNTLSNTRVNPLPVDK